MEDKTYKSLVWKFFWQQKKKEVINFFKEVWPLFAIIGVIVIICLGAVFPVIYLVTVSLAITIAIWIIIRDTYSWLTSNYKKAQIRAKKEMKRRSKR